MLRVGLTGGLGSGKTAVALVLAEGGAHVLSSDELGRTLMQPGQPVYEEIVACFGAQVLRADAQLDRRALATQAFEHGRLAELNAIVHPAVFRAQEEALAHLADEDPQGIAVIESALIFEVSRSAKLASVAEGPPGSSPALVEAAQAWRRRFDRLILVTAPDDLKIARYIARAAPAGADAATREALEQDAKRRLSAQIPDAEKAPLCDFIIENNSTLVLLRRRAQAVLAALRRR